MPIYEYICQECQSPYERIVLSRTERISCPKCGSDRQTLRFSVVSTPGKNSDGGGSTDFGGGCCNSSGCGCG